MLVYEAAARYTFIGSELLAEPEAPTEWVWGHPDGLGMWAVGDVVAIGAYSGKGKTSLIYGVATASNREETFISLPVKPGLKFLMITEASKRQAKKLLRQGGLTIEQSANIVAVVYPSVTAAVVELLCEEHRPDVVVIDSLTRIAPHLKVHHGREFSWTQPADVTDVSGYFRDLVRNFNLSLLIYACHTNKQSSADLKAFRGTGAVVEQADSAWLFNRGEGAKSDTFSRVKSRDEDETFKSLDFTYDSSTGRYAPVGVVDGGVVDMVKSLADKGKRLSKTSLAKHLGGKYETRCALIKSLVDSGTLLIDADKCVVVGKG